MLRAVLGLRRQPVRALVIVLVVVVAAFLIGFFWPGRSRQLQEKVKDEATSARDRSRRRAGKLGDWTATPSTRVAG
jgi:hypothetical protein